MFFVVFFGLYCVFLKPLEEMKMKKLLAVAMCMVLVTISVSQATYTDITFVTGNIAPTGTMTNYGGAAYHPALPGCTVANMNRPGTTGNGEVSVPVWTPEGGGADNELLIWNDGTPDEQQVMRLTFPAPVDLKELGFVACFAIGEGGDRLGNAPSFRINEGAWMVFGDPAYSGWFASGDVVSTWDYAGITGNFTDVVTVDYLLGDWVGGYSPRIGAITALEVPEPLTIGLLSLGSLALLRKRR